jgi:hypothetical protein
MSVPEEESMWTKLKSGIAGFGETVKKGVESATGPTPLTSDRSAEKAFGTPSVGGYTVGGGKRRKTRKGSKKSRKTRRR